MSQKPIPTAVGSKDVLALAFDETTGRLRVDASVTANIASAQEVVISHTDDSIKVGDGTDLLAVNSDGSINVKDGGGSITVDGTVGISGTVPVSGPLTDTQLRATPVPVSGTFYPATQPVSAASLPLPSGAATESTLSSVNTKLSDGTAKTQIIGSEGVVLNSSEVTLGDHALHTKSYLHTSDGSGPISYSLVAGNPALNVAVVSSLSALTTVSGTLPTDSVINLSINGPIDAVLVDVSGTWTGTIRVTGSLGLSDYLTGRDWFTNASVSSITANGRYIFPTHGMTGLSAYFQGFNTGAASVTITQAQNTEGTVKLGHMAVASSTPTGVVSLGNSLGKTVVMKTGTLASSATTADQVILTYTVTSGKTFYLEYFDISARLTTFAATATLFGNASLESPASTKLYTTSLAGTGVVASPIGNTFSEPVPIASGTVIRVVCTPSAATPFTWQANLGGYEK